MGFENFEIDSAYFYNSDGYNKNYAIARGTLKKKFGPIDINYDTTHVNLYLYEEADPSAEFEVVEKWEGNG